MIYHLYYLWYQVKYITDDIIYHFGLSCADIMCSQALHKICNLRPCVPVIRLLNHDNSLWCVATKVQCWGLREKTSYNISVYTSCYISWHHGIHLVFSKGPAGNQQWLPALTRTDSDGDQALGPAHWGGCTSIVTWPYMPGPLLWPARRAASSGRLGHVM
jgi:hypothetical protein